MEVELRVLINGFGRIGRLILREWLTNKYNDLDIVAINDLSCASVASHLLKYDSVHGVLNADIKENGHEIIVNEKKICYFSDANPSDIPFKELGIDVVLECTGKFKSREKCKVYTDAGVKKIIISAPGEDVDRTVVFGVNSCDITKSDTFISNASCTTNCLAPLVKVLKDTVGIEYGDMVTVHSYTGDQRLVDMGHSDLRRSRAAACNIVPTSTGAAKAIALIFPEFKGKLHGSAIRVPVQDVSLVNFTFLSKKNTSVEEINSLMKTAAEGSLKGVLKYSDLPLVSSDFKTSTFSSVFDAPLTNVQNDNLCTVVSWYDNEYGFACRMLDLASLLKNFL